jgi:hypothetical protein
LLTLPDSSHLEGHILSTLPQVDQHRKRNRYRLLNTKAAIPENLIARIKLVKSARKKIVFAEGAVLSDDIQQNFWVMKMTDSVTAVKVPVKKVWGTPKGRSRPILAWRQGRAFRQLWPGRYVQGEY